MRAMSTEEIKLNNEMKKDLVFRFWFCFYDKGAH